MQSRALWLSCHPLSRGAESLNELDIPPCAGWQRNQFPMSQHARIWKWTNPLPVCHKAEVGKDRLRQIRALDIFIPGWKATKPSLTDHGRMVIVVPPLRLLAKRHRPDHSRRFISAGH